MNIQAQELTLFCFRQGVLARAAGGLLALMLVTGCGTTGSGSGAEPRTASDQTDADRRAAVRLELASGYFARGQFTTALDEIKQALAVKPDMRDAISLRNLVYAAMGEGELAEEGFKRMLSLYPKDADTAHNYGWFLCQGQRFAAAQAQFDLALAQPQYLSPARTFLAKGVCEARAGQMAQAERSLSRAFELDPGNPSVSLNLAEVLLRLGQADRARFYVRRVNAQPEQRNAQSLWLELRIERRLGNGAAVEELTRQLRQKYPDGPEVQALLAGRFDE